MQDLARLQQSEAQEAKKEADLMARINRASESARPTKSASSVQSYLRDMERGTKDLARVHKKRADLAGRIADKSKSLHSYQERQAKDDERAAKKRADEQKRLIREREEHERSTARDLRARRKATARTAITPAPIAVSHDFFISHASEDKESFVRQLAAALRSLGANVWYDEFTLKVGDSLRRSIDRGLASSRLGVVVLSEHFFAKEWPNRELDGLVARETQGDLRILPIWHKVSKDEVARYSPTLADKLALNTSLKSVEEIADELMKFLG